MIKAQEAVQAPSCSMARRLARGCLAAAAAMLAAGAGAAAQDVSVSARVDKTSAPIGSPITLTLSVTGDVEQAELEPVTVPDAFAVMAQSRSTNLSVKSGAMERSTSISYVLMPRRIGTFQLGPFTIRHQGKSYETQPVEVTVTAPEQRRAKPEGPRYLL